jgi:hypothetical protein
MLPPVDVAPPALAVLPPAETTPPDATLPPLPTTAGLPPVLAGAPPVLATLAAPPDGASAPESEGLELQPLAAATINPQSALRDT